MKLIRQLYSFSSEKTIKLFWSWSRTYMCMSNQSTLMSSIITSVICISETRFRWTLYSVKRWLLMILLSLCLDEYLSSSLNSWDSLLVISWTSELFVELLSMWWCVESFDVCCQWEPVDAASLSESVEKWCSSCFHCVN